jgi:hypothetical protein
MDSSLSSTPFESPFDKLTVPSNVEGLTAPGEIEGEIEGVACPTGTLDKRFYVGSAIYPPGWAAPTSRAQNLRRKHQ